MIHTSYFANIKKLPKHILPISISRFPPKWFEGDTDLSLAPSEELLIGYKEGKINEVEYEKIYRTQLEKLNPEDYKKYENSALCCFEKVGDFCHRHILADWLKSHGIQVEEKTSLNVGIIGSKDFYDYDYVKYRLGQLTHIYPNIEFKVFSSDIKGAYKLGSEWARENDIELITFKANWAEEGKAAADHRNAHIVDNADIIISFWDGICPIAKKSMEYALDCGKKLFVYKMKPNELKVETLKLLEVNSLSPDKIYIFGDNMERKGKKGQAVIRDCENALGVATKRSPTVKKESYFSDLEDEINVIKSDLRKAYSLGMSGKVIVFPEDGLGTDLDKLPSKSPKAYKELDNITNIFFGIEDISEEFEKNYKEIKPQA